MNVEVTPAGPEDQVALENLLQLYAYDFSEFIDGDVDDHGRFSSISLESSSPAPVFLVRVNGVLAGFAQVQQESALTGDSDVSDIGEFFVMRKYRRRGVGRQVATRLFDMFPSRWEVREVATNVPAQAFWRDVIGEYTGVAMRRASWTTSADMAPCNHSTRGTARASSALPASPVAASRRLRSHRPRRRRPLRSPETASDSRSPCAQTGARQR